MNDQLVLWITVPLVTAFIGYITNWSAVKMMFHPAEPRGIGPLKWQGIVYRMSGKFAGEIANTTSQVLSPEDLVGRLDLAGLIERLQNEHPDHVDSLVGEALDVVAPGVWASAAPEAKTQLQAMLVAQSEAAVSKGMDELGPRLGELLDLEALVVEELTGENSERLARVAQEIGGKELRFVELYGGLLGFLVGLIQVALYGVFGVWWTMPIVGGIVGLGTNWLAIQMIFRPLEPKKFFGVFTYQGMFPKRQAEIAADYGKTAAREIFTPDKLLGMLLNGPGLPTLLTEVKTTALAELRVVAPMVSMLTGGVEPTDEQLGQLVDTFMTRSLMLAPTVQPTIEAHLAETLRLEELIEERLGSLDKEQFERMLRGIFEEDEWILIVVGGALGAAIGTLQGLAVLGFDL
ncbi:MAG: DUF445 family protein [Acidimicrobiales bacterium]|nr:DUF445 family protein [Acidimicrobiales bacterium]